MMTMRFIVSARCLVLLRNMKDKFEETIEYIVAVLKEAGYDPYEQLYAYASTGNEAYITRRGNAREIASKIDRSKLMLYLTEFPKINISTR